MTFAATTTAALVAALESAPAVCPLVGRVRLRPIAQQSPTAVVVRPQAADVQGQREVATGYPVRWVSAYQVECYARSSALADPDAAVDVLLQAVYERLFSHPSLAGFHLEPNSISFDFDVDGEQTACAVLSVTAHHATVGANL